MSHSHVALRTYRGLPPEEITPQIGELPLPGGDNPDFSADYINCNFLRVGGSLIAPAVAVDRLWARANNVGGTIPSGGSRLRLDTGWTVDNGTWTSDGTKIGFATLTVTGAGIQIPANFNGWGLFSIQFQNQTWTGSAATSEYLASQFFIDPRFASGFVYVRDSYRSTLTTKNGTTQNMQWLSEVCTPATPASMGLEFGFSSANLSVPITVVQFEVVLFPLKVID